MTRAPTRALPRAALHRSRLLRFLHDNALLHDTTPEGKVGEKLGDWLDFRQAIALHGVLYPEAGQAPLIPRRAGSMSAAALTEQFEATRAALETAVTHSARPAPGATPRRKSHRRLECARRFGIRARCDRPG